MYQKGMFLLLLSILHSCYSKNDNLYFYNIDKEFSVSDHNHEKINSIYIRELKKYKKTGDKKYLISSKYCESLIYPDDRSKRHIILIYELLKINNGQYEYIDIACNFNLAYQFECSSPKLSLQFLDEAIKQDESFKEKNLFLPHLFDAKGRWYYNQKKYLSAIFYFRKALQNFEKSDTDYIASMHNNLGMCLSGMKDYNAALKEVQIGIKILSAKPSPNNNDLFLLYLMKGNSGYYYYMLKDYVNAEKYVLQEEEFYKNKKEYYKYTIDDREGLLEIYKATHQSHKEMQVINGLLKILPQLINIKDKIKACRLLKNYYSRINDLENFKIYSEKLMKLSDSYQERTSKELYNASDILNGYILKNINQKYYYKLANQRRKILGLVLLTLLLIVIFFNIIVRTRNRNIKEKKILEANKKNLEKDIRQHKEKIKNLHLNLNLKLETEKAFLESLKKAKKAKKTDIEETIKDLYFKTNNLIEIDKKNNDLIDESSIVNKYYTEKLLEKFPNLTSFELQLCIYFRLNLSSKEVSLLGNITPGSARVYKAKVKNKMRLNKEDNLTVFLNTLA